MSDRFIYRSAGLLRRQGTAGKSEGAIVVAPRDTSGFTVCLVDDDPSVLKATGRLLSSAGWKVALFADPVEFLRYAQIQQPKIVVLDIRMPQMNGLEVQTRLRSISSPTRVIILTSKDDQSVRSQAIQAGASAFFVKPVHDEEFLAGIESVLSEE